MGCLFFSKKTIKKLKQYQNNKTQPQITSKVNENKEMVQAGGITHIAAETFSFHELADAANNFRSDYLLGEGGFGRVYRGRLERTNQARPLFKERRKFSQMVDPALEGQYPARGLFQALAVAAMCVQDQPSLRPGIADVVTALTYLASQKNDP
ncbi:hypothetical protein CTI12_AA502760 [Artemisia annua]|uniref:Concanavalin A-like lectin/glucanase, subgroup n=1 Tax=Artemisia annua TaxID=35608 RepID=A0A2U1LC00_ARTAN|nr:hypothetical protein CTI12_AA502760 [Artemisia annua]